MRSKLLFGALAAIFVLPAGLAAMAQVLDSADRGRYKDMSPLATPQTGPSGIITTVAGDGYAGNDGNGGLATSAHLFFPEGVAVDSAGNFYIADPLAQEVRKVTVSTGIISLVAGTGDAGYSGDKGPATAAQLNEPAGVAVDALGNVYIADSRNNVIRKVDAHGAITTVAGNGYGAAQAGGKVECGTRTDGIAATASPLCLPLGVAVDTEGDLFIADTENSVIREVNAANGIITTVAGGGSFPYPGDGGLAVNASLNYPFSVALDGSGNLYITDTYRCAVRKVTASTGIITSLAGKFSSYGQGACGLSGDGGPATSAELNFPQGVAVDPSGNVFIADSNNSLIRMIAASDGNIYTLAGSYLAYQSGYATFETGYSGYAGDGGPAAYAVLDDPESVAADSFGSLYIADTGNSAIRKVTMAAASPAEAPVFSPPPGTVTSPATVSIMSPVDGSAIFYTADGTIPTTSSARYTGPIQSIETGVITAFATSPGALNSPASIGRYFYAPTPVISPGSKNITKNTRVTITEANTKATIYYTTDGNDPSSRSTAQKYTGAISISSATTLKAQAEVVDAQGYSGWSAIATATYTFTGPPTVTNESVFETVATQVQLFAQINPNNASTQYTFVYGTSANALTNTTGTVVGLTGTTTSDVYAYVNGLTANATYYFQAVASNSLGTTKGPVQSFKTNIYTVTPVISPGAEIITAAVKVTIAEANPAAAIYYTTDGSTPRDSRTPIKYTGSFIVSTTTTVNAQAEVAIAPGETLWSGAASATYTVPAAPTITSESDTEQSATQDQISAYIFANGADTQYWFAYGTSAAALTRKTARMAGPQGANNGSVSVTLSGLSPNTTYYYQAVASNSVGTTKGAVQSFATDYYVSTPVISPGSETIATPIKVTITQSNPAASIYYTTDGSYVCYNSAAVKYNGPITISASTNLTAVTEVQNGQGTLCSSTATATYILPAAPTVSNESETQYSADLVELSASINPNGETTQYLFTYGRAANALTSTTATFVGLTGLTSTNVSIALNGLIPNTTYYFRAKATNSAGTTKGPVMSFTTSFYTVTPVISPGTEIITKAIKVTITQPNPAATIYYTTDGSYPTNDASAIKYTGPFTVAATTTVNAVAEVTNATQGTQWSNGASATYTVPTAPAISSESDYELSGTQDQLSAYVNADGADTQCWFTYGTSATALTQKSAKTAGPQGTNSGSVSITLSGLNPNTTYYYQAVASNSAGTAKGAVQSFTTDFYEPTPVISPGSENIAKPIKVTITQSNPVASIFYTTDGSQPCNNSAATSYNGPITISATTILTAVTEVQNAQGYSSCGASATATYVLPAAPTVSNESASAYWTDFAQVSADICPNGETTEYWFAYGTSATALTSTTSKTGGLTGATAINESTNLNGLTTKTTYYYRAVASNSLGTTKGAVESFTTQ